MRQPSYGFVFHSAPEDCGGYEPALEIDGFPLRSSLRVVGLNQHLASLGVERGRLFHMYKIGKDTAAVMLILMHGASRLSLDGYGSIVLPDWCSDGVRAELLLELQTLGRAADVCCPLTSIALYRIRHRCSLSLLGGRLSGPTRPSSLVIPTRAGHLSWAEVSYRLTLGWLTDAEGNAELT